MYKRKLATTLLHFASSPVLLLCNLDYDHGESPDDEYIHFSLLLGSVVQKIWSYVPQTMWAQKEASAEEEEKDDSVSCQLCAPSR